LPTEISIGPLGVMLWAVVAQLVVGVVHAWSRYALPDDSQTLGLSAVLVAEAVDTLVVVIALVVLARRAVPSKLPVEPHRWVWLWSWPALAVLLGVNMGYHALLQMYVNEPPDLIQPDSHEAYRLWWILAICVQPAIVEELCFRGIALRCLSPFMSVKAAVVIASAAFAMAHLGAFLSIPYLFLLGLFLGIARVRSGGLVLPMLLHAAHNACVLWLKQTL
jgi:membrane protease YdiL (CAAX protease family)